MEWNRTLYSFHTQNCMLDYPRHCWVPAGLDARRRAGLAMKSGWTLFGGGRMFGGKIGLCLGLGLAVSVLADRAGAACSGTTTVTCTGGPAATYSPAGGGGARFKPASPFPSTVTIPG